MSFSRIRAIILQELFITRRSLEVIVDLPYFSVQTIVVFGFFSLFLSGTSHLSSANYLILGLLLWEIIRIVQYSISVAVLWNIWSRNLSNMFITPLTIKEYFIAQMLSGIIKTIVIFSVISVIASLLFKFNILSVGLINLILFFINLTFFGWSVGIIIVGTIFRFGTRIQSLAWGLVFIFQPLTASLFPVKILPPFFQAIAYMLPPTYVFEAARASLADPSVKWEYMGIAFIQNIIYLLLSLWLFNIMFNKSKETGQFAKNEG
ncbi:MAG: hypothetical protein A2857_02735 [Candidatus Levybacteria bacterium RIFCSPHIGHO2_01_FULL_36_15]|nr:MAG: hypothetical protein A2857_02735 [Candidatus Levybacteria bacterium RIFCSPHIGHO2_01_FULL_36_15]OGH38505.1 MAG: hypothetical protein A2905_02060 [Candidatus Levybacteria bacterium RIFCSPLOWO2_01_FULL_36_10]